MNQVLTQAPLQPKKSKKWLWWIIIPLVVLAIAGGVLLWWIMGGISGTKGVAANWLTELSSKQVDQAYNQTATDFKSGTDSKQFQAFLDAYPIMTHVKEVKFSSIDRTKTGDKDIETLTGTLTGTDGKTSPIKMMLIQENGKWVVYNVDLRGL